MFHFIFALICIKVALISAIKVERSEDGDIFGILVQNTCHLYKATCISNECSFWSSCCDKCKCGGQETFYEDLCYADPAHSKIRCAVAIEDNQYYGLKTYKLEKDEPTDIGYVVMDRRSDTRYFKSCQVSAQSAFWDTKVWTGLFTGGRKNSDFQFLKDEDGVKLKFVGDAQLYSGMLLKLQVDCQTIASSNSIKSCLLLKIAGGREYQTSPTIKPPTTSTTTPTTTTPTTPTTTTATKNKTTQPTQPTTLHTTVETTISPATTNAHTSSKPATSRPPTLPTSVAPTAHTSFKDDERRELMTTIVILCTLVIIVLAVSTWCCWRRWSVGSINPERGTLATQSSLSYHSMKSEVGVNSDFENIAVPTFSDVKELFNKGEGGGGGGSASINQSSQDIEIAVTRPQRSTPSQPFETIDETPYCPQAPSLSTTQNIL